MTRPDALAEELSRAFFSHGDVAVVDVDVDAMFAAALDTFEGILDGIDADLARSVFSLLRDVRHGLIDRRAARSTANVLLRHLCAAVGVQSIAPLVRFLGALAVLPDGPDRFDRAYDPTPSSELPIEVAIAAALDAPDDARRREELRRAVFGGVLHLPVLDISAEGRNLALQFLPLKVRDKPAVAAFTEPERFTEYLRAAQVGEFPLLEIDGSELATLVPPGHSLAVNPGSVLGCALDDVEIRTTP